MSCAATILADVEDILQVVVVMMFLIIAAIASLLQKAAQKRRAEQAEAQRRASPDQQRQAPSTAQRKPPPRPPTPAEEIARAMREALGLEPQRPTAPPREVPPTQAEAARPILTAEEVQRRRAGRRGRLQRRRPRPTTLPPSEIPAGEGRRIPRARVEATPPPTLEPRRGKLNLDNVQQARRAIVFHEIFSAPKALRKGSEMWDL